MQAPLTSEWRFECVEYERPAERPMCRSIRNADATARSAEPPPTPKNRTKTSGIRVTPTSAIIDHWPAV